ncbi:medium-chain acyl-CoA ligase ACSF2, mitochondrial-like [Phlebotomus papatasi]|uniref:medium-chain acyl-CoA ligase ACSF2, mitochondrial-like n=1 Tax=Phlebotomus papatasi TaxID=29031 RepID=UPI0024844A67|nr:medium-chain acyl-CoA ligase ACSF2, mitochondrial-like [Phlebotomus papatasi]
MIRLVSTLKILSRIQKTNKIFRKFYTNHNGLSYIQKIGKYPLVYRTIGQELSRVANEFGDREAYVFVEEKKRFTYGQLKVKADRLAAGFQAIGLKTGDRIGIWAPNMAMWPVVLYAAARAGLILVALNPAYQVPEAEICLQKAGIKALVTSESFRDKEYYEKILQIVPKLNKVSHGKIQSEKLPFLSSIIIDSEKYYPGTLRLKDVSSMAASSQIKHIEFQQKCISPDSGSNIRFTSGTTGNPKPALLSHFALINNGINSSTGMDEKRFLMPIPFFHIYGSLVGAIGSLSRVATTIVPSIVYNSEKALQSIQDEKCDIIFGVPTMYSDLVEKQKKLKLDLKAEIAANGSDSLPPQLCSEIQNVLGVKRVQHLFGMTESSGTSFSSLPGDTEKQIFETVGHVQDHIEVKVTDKHGDLVPFGTPGELNIRGYITMLGYWDDEEKTREILARDGWLRTGDQFILQADGYGKVVGRLKEVIVRGADKIFPKEIEILLSTCPQIAEIHIVAVPDKRLGEELFAFVRLQPGIESFTASDIKKFCDGKISYFKIPQFMEVVTEFPRTASGKVQKFKLEELAKEKYAKIKDAIKLETSPVKTTI